MEECAAVITIIQKERTDIMNKKLISLFAAAVLLFLPSCSEEPVMPEPVAAGNKNVDVNVTLQEDFYGYVNRDFIQNGKIPYLTYSYSTFDSIKTKAVKDISTTIKECSASKAERGSVEQKVGDLYLQFMDDKSRAKDGIMDILMAVSTIQNAKTIDEYIKSSGQLYNGYGINSLFSFKVGPDLSDSSKNSLYLDCINTCGNDREDFIKSDYCTNNIYNLALQSLEMMGIKKESADKRAKAVAAMVTEIVKSGSTSDEMQNSDIIKNKYTTDKLQKLYSNIKTDSLIKSFGFDSNEFYVCDTKQAEKINEYLTEEHLTEIKDFALVCFAYTYISALPSDYSNVKDTVMVDTAKEYEARNFVLSALESEVSILYGKRVCTDKTISSAKEMITEIRNSFSKMISRCNRLSDQSKSKFQNKLDNMNFIIGYDNNYSSTLDIVPSSEGGSLIKNYIGIKASQVSSQKKLLKSAAKNIYNKEPQSVEVSYDPITNSITIPPALLESPCFTAGGDKYANLGRLGFIVAHEMMHAFDEDGICYDENGCFNENWIDKNDRSKLDVLLDKTVKYYNNYKLLGMFNVDGEKTLSENFADLGALQCIVSITNNKNELKTIYENLAAQWASLDDVKIVVTNLCYGKASPSEARVNAAVSCMNTFYQVFDIKENDKMYVAPEERIKVW